VGYRKIAGVDLNPDLARMPHSGEIEYLVCDYLATPFARESFAAITAISVIEHGFQPERLLAECARLLQPGGYFIASFDYWPDKIQTEQVRLFGLPWQIFSRDEVVAFVRRASDYGFRSVAPLELEAQDRVIHWGGYDYTFAWLALHKERG
jgi:SAM-dependent methyltransferase